MATIRERLPRRRKFYAPPAPPLAGPVSFTDPDLFEVKVYRGGGGWNLVAAVELVSESNKDREESRRAFAIQCGEFTYKAESRSWFIDTVTSRTAELLNELHELLELPDAMHWSSESGISVRLLSHLAEEEGDPARSLADASGGGRTATDRPLWLTADLAAPLELELTYEAACRSLRIR